MFETSFALAEELTSECMAHLGFDYQPAALPVAAKAASTEQPVRGYGFVDSLNKGFQSVDFGNPDRGEAEGSEVALSEEAQAVYEESLNGVGGCREESRKQADDEVGFGFLEDRQQAVDSAFARWNALPDVVASQAAWASCMANAGFPEVASQAAISGVLTEAWNDDLKHGSNKAIALEIRLFDADSSCPQPLQVDAEYLADAIKSADE